MRTIITTLIVTCILLLSSGCTQYIEWVGGEKVRQYNSAFKTVTADSFVVGDVVVKSPASTPQDAGGKLKIPHTPIEAEFNITK